MDKLQNTFNDYYDYNNTTQYKVLFSDWVLHRCFVNAEELDRCIDFGLTATYTRNAKKNVHIGRHTLETSCRALLNTVSRGNEIDCRICFANTIDVIGACGHPYCISCAQRSQKSQYEIECFVCRQTVTVGNIYNIYSEKM